MIHKMGHDITAIQDDEQVAYLRRSMSSCAVHHLYQVLDSLDCYGGCSGTGEVREFNLKEIKSALIALQDGPTADQRPAHFGDYLVESLGLSPQMKEEDTDLEQKFLHNILTRSHEFTPVKISFM